MKKETKFDKIIRLLEEQYELIRAQAIVIIELQRQVKQYRYRVTLITMLFFAIILGILIVITG